MMLSHVQGLRPRQLAVTSLVLESLPCSLPSVKVKWWVSPSALESTSAVQVCCASGKYLVVKVPPRP